MSNNKLVVAIQMITYNHEEYIAQAIESVMAQETTFDYKLIIAEDFSTDNTRNICKALKQKYPNKIDLILNEKNLGVFKNAIQIHEACYNSNATYVAIIEGDDYWTDNFKLQKQVDFLESNKNYTVCFHNVKKLTVANGEPDVIVNYNQTFKDTYEFNDIIIENNIATVSVMYVNKIFDISVFDTVEPYDDFFHLLNLEKGKAKFFEDTMAVYRIHKGGTWSSRKIEEKYLVNIHIRKMILNYFKSNPKYKNNNLFYLGLSPLYNVIAIMKYNENNITCFFNYYFAYLYNAYKSNQTIDYMLFAKLSIKIFLRKIKISQRK